MLAAPFAPWGLSSAQWWASGAGCPGVVTIALAAADGEEAVRDGPTVFSVPAEAGSPGRPWFPGNQQNTMTIQTWWGRQKIFVSQKGPGPEGTPGTPARLAAGGAGEKGKGRREVRGMGVQVRAGGESNYRRGDWGPAGLRQLPT